MWLIKKSKNGDEEHFASNRIYDNRLINIITLPSLPFSVRNFFIQICEALSSRWEKKENNLWLHRVYTIRLSSLVQSNISFLVLFVMLIMIAQTNCKQLSSSDSVIMFARVLLVSSAPILQVAWLVSPSPSFALLSIIPPRFNCASSLFIIFLSSSLFTLQFLFLS